MKKILLLCGAIMFFVDLGLYAQEDLTPKGVDVAPKPAKLWTRELSVETTSENFDGAVYPAYSIVVHDIKSGQLGKMLRDDYKNRANKITSKKVILAEKTSIPEVQAGYMDLVVRIDDLKTAGASRMSVAFLYDGVAISAATDSISDLKAKEFMYKEAVRLNRAVVNEQAAEQEKTLDKLRKDLEKLETEHKKLHQSIEKSQRTLAKAQEDQAKAERELVAARGNVTEFENRIGAAGTDKDLKELAKLRKNVDRLESRISKAMATQNKALQSTAEARNAIPKNESDQEAKKEEIERQKVVLMQYRTKMHEVQ
jgi:hypothetical protein